MRDNRGNNDSISVRTIGIRLQSGFTLLEVLVSVALFSIVSMGLAKGFIMQMKSNTDTEIRTQAITAAQYLLDELRTVDPASLPTSGSDPAQSVVIGGRTYSVVISYCKLGSFCTAATTRHLRATVTYQGKKRYEVDTVFAQLR